jgi:hypothetical protein
MKNECMLVLDAFFSSMRKAQDYTVFACDKQTTILEAEDRLSEKWTGFESLSTDDWREIRSVIDLTGAGLLLVYAMRMSIFAVREKSVAKIWYGLMGIVLDNDVLDYRDVLSIATLLYDAAVRLQVPAEDLFHRASTHATPQRARLLDGFVRAPAFTKSIRSKGFEAVYTDDGFVYRSLT